MSGGAYYKALRAHLLIDAALVSYIMKDLCTDEELTMLKEFLVQCKANKSGSSCTSPIIETYGRKLKEKLHQLKESGRTPALWVKYHEMVSQVKDFIRAERQHQWSDHLRCVSQMLNVFAAGGHGQYAKGARLYLELTLKHSTQYKAVMNTFTHKGLHTVRYSGHEWSGI